MYHGTVWNLHQVHQMWKWQTLDILDVVHGYDRDFAGHPTIQRGRLDATHGTNTSDDPMVLRIRQVELCTLSPMLLRRGVSAAHNPARWIRWIHGKRVFSSDWLQQPLRKNPCRSNDRRNGEQRHTYARGTKGFSLKPGAVSRYYLTAEYRAVYLKTLRGMIDQAVPNFLILICRVQGYEKMKQTSRPWLIWCTTTCLIHYLLMNQTSLACPLRPWPHRQWSRIF